MPSSAEVSDQKLTAAITAVNYILNRICDDPQIAYLMNDCTESYGLLCAAMAAYKEVSVEEIEDSYRPCNNRKGKPVPDLKGEAAFLGMSAAHVAACEALNIAPFIASSVLKHAERRGRPLPEPRRDPENGTLDIDFLARCDRAWIEYSTHARAGGVQFA